MIVWRGWKSQTNAADLEGLGDEVGDSPSNRVTGETSKVPCAYTCPLIGRARAAELIYLGLSRLSVQVLTPQPQSLWK